MKLRVSIILLILVVAAGGAYLVTRPDASGAGGEAPGGAPAGRPPAKVHTVVLDEREFISQVEALGTIQADESIDITANVTEIIGELFFEDGDQVKTGDQLALLQDDEERAILEGAQANLREQEREIARLESLVKEGAVPEVRLQEYLTRRDVAAQRVLEVEAQLADRVVSAPFSGVLGVRRVSPGALVSPGIVITTLDKLDTVKLDFTVPETFLSELKSGLEIEAHSAAYPTEVFPGVVSNVDSRVNPVTRSVRVRARLNNPGLRLRPGMLMTVTLRSSPRMAVALPERSLVTVQQRQFVFAVESGPEGLATARQVVLETGRRVPGYVEVRSGLKAGQTVVTDGLLGLSDGRPLEVTGEFQGTSEPYNPAGNKGNISVR